MGKTPSCEPGHTDETRVPTRAEMGHLGKQACGSDTSLEVTLSHLTDGTERAAEAMLLLIACDICMSFFPS